jgi:hypothetical protein
MRKVIFVCERCGSIAIGRMNAQWIVHESKYAGVQNTKLRELIELDRSVTTFLISRTLLWYQLFYTQEKRQMASEK